MHCAFFSFGSERIQNLSVDRNEYCKRISQVFAEKEFQGGLKYIRDWKICCHIGMIIVCVTEIHLKKK